MHDVWFMHVFIVAIYDSRFRERLLTQDRSENTAFRWRGVVTKQREGINANRGSGMAG